MAKPLCAEDDDPPDWGLITLTTGGLIDCACWIIIDFGEFSPSVTATALAALAAMETGLLSVGDLALAGVGLGFFCFGESEFSAGPGRGDLLSSGVRTGANGGGIIIPCVGEAGADLKRITSY